MPNVDDHGLEVLKKAARNLDVVPKKDYALQVILVKDESDSGDLFSPQIENIDIILADTEVEITLPTDYKYFLLKARKISRLKISYVQGETGTKYMSVPKGGVWVEDKKLNTNKIYLESNVANNIIELILYK